jgi:hypothetical protein
LPAPKDAPLENMTEFRKLPLTENEMQTDENEFENYI